MNEYLFERAGVLSLREYAADSDARDLVKQAVDQIDELLEPSPAVDEKSDALSPHIAASIEALDQGDVVAALARLRLGIELDANQLAEREEMQVKGVGAAQAVRSLVKNEAISPSEGERLSHAIRIANGALHGETVSRGEAREAIKMASGVLSHMAQRTRA